MGNEGKEMYTILIVEDAPEIYDPLSEYLQEQQFSTQIATTQAQAIALLEDPDRSFDLALIDLKLPDGHGFSISPSAKERHIPVIFLTAMDDENNASTCLKLGDDYIPKPYRRKELLERIRKVLGNTGKYQTEYKCQDITVDTARSTVYKGKEEIFLTRLEYKLLLVFMRNIGKLVTRDQLVDEIYDISGDWISDNTLNVHIGRLRKKVEDDPNDPRFIQTVRGLGYKVEK